jgi:hypothetical protein
MKLCIEGDIYFIPKFHILETGTVKLSIETGLRGDLVLSKFEGREWAPGNWGMLYGTPLQ